MENKEKHFLEHKHHSQAQQNSDAARHPDVDTNRFCFHYLRVPKHFRNTLIIITLCRDMRDLFRQV